MVGILLITHFDLGASLIHCAAHILGSRPERLEALAVLPGDDAAEVSRKAQKIVERLDDGNGVLIIADMFGATPSMGARLLLESTNVLGLAGANLPMLMRALTYRNEPLAQVAEKAMTGCIAGALRMDKDRC